MHLGLLLLDFVISGTVLVDHCVNQARDNKWEKKP